MCLVTDRLMRLVLVAGLALGVAMFVGCGGGGDDSGGGDGGSDSSDRGGSDGDASGGGSSGGASVSMDHSSPEALFGSIMDAARQQNYGAIAGAYTPDTQREMAAGMISMAATADMVPGVSKEDCLPILEKHGIAESDLPAMGPQMMPQAETLADGLDDRTAFIGDMMTLLPDMLQGITDTFGDTAAGATSLTDVQVDGDTATARVTAAGQTSEEENRISFVRIEDKWYISD
ncbi:MAG: hypothetical protein ACIAXF_15370 [Phycisphaerales bacterium JB063]